MIVQSLNLKTGARKDEDLRVSQRPPHILFFCSTLNSRLGFCGPSSAVKPFLEVFEFGERERTRRSSSSRFQRNRQISP